jgi:hypothetical protein
MAVAGQLKYGTGGGESKTYSPAALVQGKFIPVHIWPRADLNFLAKRSTLVPEGTRICSH